MTIRQSLASAGAELATLLRTRVELLALEFAKERSRLLRSVLLALGALLFGLLGLLVFSVWIALLFWSTEYRYLSIALLALVYVLIAVVFIVKLRNQVRRGGPPFAASVEVLSQDLEMLRAACLKAPPHDASDNNRAKRQKGDQR